MTDYRRELDLDSGIARVSYRFDGAAFTREVFASAVDQVLGKTTLQDLLRSESEMIAWVKFARRPEAAAPPGSKIA